MSSPTGVTVGAALPFSVEAHQKKGTPFAGAEPRGGEQISSGDLNLEMVQDESGVARISVTPLRYSAPSSSSEVSLRPPELAKPGEASSEHLMKLLQVSLQGRKMSSVYDTLFMMRNMSLMISTTQIKSHERQINDLTDLNRMRSEEQMKAFQEFQEKTKKLKFLTNFTNGAFLLLAVAATVAAPTNLAFILGGVGVVTSSTGLADSLTDGAVYKGNMEVQMALMLLGIGTTFGSQLGQSTKAIKLAFTAGAEKGAKGGGQAAADVAEAANLTEKATQEMVKHAAEVGAKAGRDAAAQHLSKYGLSGAQSSMKVSHKLSSVKSKLMGAPDPKQIKLEAARKAEEAGQKAGFKAAQEHLRTLKESDFVSPPKNGVKALVSGLLKVSDHSEMASRVRPASVYREMGATIGNDIAATAQLNQKAADDLVEVLTDASIKAGDKVKAGGQEGILAQQDVAREQIYKLALEHLKKMSPDHHFRVPKDQALLSKQKVLEMTPDEISSQAKALRAAHADVASKPSKLDRLVPGRGAKKAKAAEDGMPEEVHHYYSQQNKAMRSNVDAVVEAKAKAAMEQADNTINLFLKHGERVGSWSVLVATIAQSSLTMMTKKSDAKAQELSGLSAISANMIEIIRNLSRDSQTFMFSGADAESKILKLLKDSSVSRIANIK